VTRGVNDIQQQLQFRCGYVVREMPGINILSESASDSIDFQWLLELFQIGQHFGELV